MIEDKASHILGSIKIKPISMIIPPRKKSKRTLFKGSKQES